MASQVGADILKAGGNAVDAGVAVGFALAVTYPQAGNIGGGGFMVIHLAKENKSIAIDYREMAPGRAHRDMYLNEEKVPFLMPEATSINVRSDKSFPLFICLTHDTLLRLEFLRNLLAHH